MPAGNHIIRIPLRWIVLAAAVLAVAGLVIFIWCGGR